MKSALVLVLLLGACGTPTESVSPALAQIYASPAPSIVAPDSVRVNVPFSVTVLSYGSGSRNCNEPSGTSVNYVSGVARIQAFMRYPTGDIVCTADLRPYPQSANVTFTTAGISVIRLLGVTRSRDAKSLDSIEKRVVVLP